MEKQTFTPGPWKLVPREVLEDDSVYPTHIVGGQREIQVCLMESFFAAKRAHDNPEMKSAVFEADCRLIAAAPDLYEALKEIIDTEWIGGKGGFVKARAALAKARGES